MASFSQTATTYGIGQGLSNFASSYQAARQYRDQVDAQSQENDTFDRIISLYKQCNSNLSDAILERNKAISERDEAIQRQGTINKNIYSLGSDLEWIYSHPESADYYKKVYPSQFHKFIDLVASSATKKSN